MVVMALRWWRLATAVPLAVAVSDTVFGVSVVQNSNNGSIVAFQPEVKQTELPDTMIVLRTGRQFRTPKLDDVVVFT